MTWQSIESAPRDGTVFIGRNADHPSFGSYAMLRHVRWRLDENTGKRVMEDMGAWIIVRDNGPDFDNFAPEHRFPFAPISLAADEWNRSVRYEWMPFPEDT